MVKYLPFLALTVSVAAFSGCATSSTEPTNLGLEKQALRRYIASGEYDRAMVKAAAKAEAWIEERAKSRKSNERLTVVFDLDDTLLLNEPYLADNDFGWNPSAWQVWVDAAHAQPIVPTREIYRHARRLNLDVIYLTARPEHDRAATIRNLKFIECDNFAELICRPDELKTTAASFKAEQRKSLTSEGRVVIAMIGDQDSDLAGGYAERMFKLPNPFYYTP